MGGVWDQEQLDQLYANTVNYLHGHSVGGTNPSLLRAMGAGCHVTALDVSFNRGVLGEHGRFFADEAAVSTAVELVEAEAISDPLAHAVHGAGLQERAGAVYQWDAVAADYHEMARRLKNRELKRPGHSGKRRT